MNDWKPRQFGEIADFSNGLNFSEKNDGRGLKIVRVKDFGNRHFVNWKVLSEINPAGLKISDKVYLEPDDIVIVRSNGNKDLVGRSMIYAGPACTTAFAGFCIRARVRKAEALPKFVHYWLRSPMTREKLSREGGGTGIQNVSQGLLKMQEIALPTLSEQERISNTLAAIDNKIEMNRRMSRTLEEMARALYRSWFVDFGPVHASALGQFPAHMPTTTAALFPDSFGPDGLPTGWGWRFFEDYYSVLETGKRPKGGIKDVVDGVPSIGAESIKRIGSFDFSKTKFIPREFFEKMRKGHLNEGDILIYKDGGKPGELRPAATLLSKGFPFSEACINEHVFRIRVSEELGQLFGFLAISSDHCMNQMRELATGVAQPGLNQSAMKALSFIMPHDLEIIRRFEEFVRPLLDGCNERAKESQTLATLRDTLLPRLMSGEIRIREAENQVEEAVSA